MKTGEEFNPRTCSTLLIIRRYLRASLRWPSTAKLPTGTWCAARVRTGAAGLPPRTLLATSE